MSDTRYLTVAKPSEGLYKEKGSRFLAFAFPVRSREEVKEILLEFLSPSLLLYVSLYDSDYT